MTQRRRHPVGGKSHNDSLLTNVGSWRQVYLGAFAGFAIVIY
jgi:hypothetical protein